MSEHPNQSDPDHLHGFLISKVRFRSCKKVNAKANVVPWGYHSDFICLIFFHSFVKHFKMFHFVQNNFTAKNWVLSKEFVVRGFGERFAAKYKKWDHLERNAPLNWILAVITSMCDFFLFVIMLITVFLIKHFQNNKHTVGELEIKSNIRKK